MGIFMGELESAALLPMLQDFNANERDRSSDFRGEDYSCWVTDLMLRGNVWCPRKRV